jgi:hypothetical protein
VTSTQPQREQKKNEPVGGSQKIRQQVATAFRPPLTLNDAHSPALRLGHLIGPSHPSLAHPLQTKLTLNQPGDQYEQEADLVAEQVMRMPEPALRLQRKCGCGSNTSGAACEECEGGKVQLKKHGSEGQANTRVPDIVHEVLRAPGQPLDSSTRAFMEPRFGHDFSQVRVLADSKASESARSVGALAYTVGNKLVFAAGQYAPNVSESRRLIAHELTHVVQQSASVPQVQTSLEVNETSGADEAQADAVAARVMSGQSVSSHLNPAKPGVLQRAVSVPILPFNQPGAQVCIVHLHGNEENALHTAESIWTDYCSNMVHLGSTGHGRCVDVGIPGRQCTADPNRIFSDPAIDAGEPFTGDCSCEAAALPTAKLELKAFRPRLEGAIGRCRGGSGSGIDGPLPTVAFHNNTTPGGLSIGSYVRPPAPAPSPTGRPTPPVRLTADQLAADTGATRTGGVANPSILTGTGPDPHQLRDPDNFLLVTDPADFAYFRSRYNVVMQGTTPETVRPSFDDGSLAVRMRNQRYVNIEAQGKPFTGTSSPFYITDRQMGEGVMLRLGIGRRPCPTPTAPGATTGTAAVGPTTPATGSSCRPVTSLSPCLTECRTFTDQAQLDSLKGCWRSQINTLPVNDAVCWMIGRQAPPPAVRTETVRQRDCMLDGLRGAAAARSSGIALPSASPGPHYANRSWLVSDYRPAVRLPGVRETPQEEIWLRKFNFTYTTRTSRGGTTFTAEQFDRISSDARTICGATLLLPTETKWDPVNDRHRVCWGVAPLPGHTAPPLGSARALTANERQREILQASSAPGISRHHWGTDFDLFSVEPQAWTPGSGATPNFSPAYDWLAGRPATGTTPAGPGNAARYGFLQSFTASSAAGMGYMEERWHWSYYPVAQALLEFSLVPAVDTELNRQLSAAWGSAPAYSRPAANWRSYLRNVNQTPRF